MLISFSLFPLRSHETRNSHCLTTVLHLTVRVCVCVPSSYGFFFRLFSINQRNLFITHAAPRGSLVIRLHDNLIVLDDDLHVFSFANAAV